MSGRALATSAGRIAVFGLLCALSLSGCETFGEYIPSQNIDDDGPRVIHGSVAGSTQFNGADAQSRAGQPGALLVKGDDAARAQNASADEVSQADGGIVLNFDGADIRDVAKAVLGDQLHVSYTIDPAVKGTVILHTATAMPREQLIPALSDAFKIAGVALVAQKSGYEIIPLAGAAQRGSFASNENGQQAGYQIQLVPLRWAVASDIQRALEPLVPAGTIVASEAHAKFVVLSGTQSDIDRAERAISIFDVDWLRQKSFGLFPLKYSTAKDVTKDLEAVVGKQGPLANGVEITPIDHLNSILVVSNNFSRVTQMRSWIERFDRGRDVLAQKIFIYHVQNGNARDLAAVLSKVFSGNAVAGKTKTQSDGSFAAAVSAENGGAGAAPTAASGSVGPYGAVTKVSATGSTSPGAFVPPGATGAGDADPGSSDTEALKITADEANNALIIATTPKMYGRIESALAQLDRAPLQVLIEATIAEVDITDTFQYGVQSSIQNGALSVLSSNVPAASIGPTPGGLSISLNRGDISATLNLLSSLTKTKVIAAPKLLVVNNKPASIQVGDQVPVATSSAVSTQGSGAPIVNTIQMLDTGIILHVTPRVNNSGAIMIDLAQEVSSSVPTVSSNIDSPTIQQRRVNTTVQVEDGQTIIIGGLINDTRGRQRVGIPVLKDIPVVGTLFGTTTDNTNRTEMMVLLTPHVVRNGQDADAATEEIRAKLPLLRKMAATNAD